MEHEQDRRHHSAAEREEWQTFRQEAQCLERGHLEIRKALRDAETALQADPGSADLETRVVELKKKLEEIERRAPWITSEIPIEIQLWGICRFM